MSKKTKPEAEEQEQVKTEAPAEETAKADAKPATDWEASIRPERSLSPHGGGSTTTSRKRSPA